MNIWGSTLKLFHSKLVSLLVIFLLTYFLLGAGIQHIEPVDFWKEKVLESHGGVDALERISTLFFRGEIITRGDSGSVTLTLSRPQKLRAVMKYTQKYEDRVLIGNKGWRDFGYGFEEAVGHSLDAMIFQFNHLNLPMGFLDNKFKISYAEQKVAEQKIPILELIAKDEPPMAVVIDPETGLIRQVNGKIFMGKNKVVMGIGYYDYRKVDGVMLPHRIINYVNGMAIAESRYDSVQVNAQIDPKSFYMDEQTIAR